MARFRGEDLLDVVRCIGHCRGVSKGDSVRSTAVFAGTTLFHVISVAVRENVSHQDVSFLTARCLDTGES